MERLPSSVGISPVSWLLKRNSRSQVGEVAQFRRYLPGQLVAGRGLAVPQVGEVAQLPWVSPQSIDSPTGNSEPQVGEVPQFRRYLPGQPVIVESFRYHRFDPLPSAPAVIDAGQPVRRIGSSAQPGWKGSPVPSESRPVNVALLNSSTSTARSSAESIGCAAAAGI